MYILKKRVSVASVDPSAPIIFILGNWLLLWMARFKMRWNKKHNFLSSKNFLKLNKIVACFTQHHKISLRCFSTSGSRNNMMDSEMFNALTQSANFPFYYTVVVGTRRFFFISIHRCIPRFHRQNNYHETII